MSEPRKKRRVECSSDPKVWHQWLLEEDSSDNESCNENEDPDVETDHLSESEHDTDTEQSGDEESDYGEEHNSFYLGKDGRTKWVKSLSKRNVRTRRENIITHLPGPKGEATKISSEGKLLDLFLDSNVYDVIVASTNIYINLMKENFSRERDARETDEAEIRALFGLLYLIGSFSCSRTNTKKLWDNSKGNGLESCYLTMSEKRFKFLLKCLRFDDVRDRISRKDTDKLAAIRQVFEIVNNNFSKYFVPSEYLTVDEQLLAFRGKCSFRQYLPKKPAKYGLKTFALVDAKMAYTHNLEPYVGLQPEGPFRKSNSPFDIVLRLVEPVKGSHRNITADNWFSSYPLANELLVSKGLTYVGTLRKNKAEIPPEFLANKQRQPNSSLFGFQENMSLVSYCPKKNQAVLVLSTLHHDSSIDEETGESKKPEIITFYNMTKIGVDLLDQLCQNYDVSRNTRRWPMVHFFNLLNIAAINAFCIYKTKTAEKIKRATFIECLAWEMIKPQIQHRSTLPQLPIELRRRACVLLGTQLKIPESAFAQGSSKGRCYDCGRHRDKSTRKWCDKCHKWMCVDHLRNVCASCFV